MDVHTLPGETFLLYIAILSHTILSHLPRMAFPLIRFPHAVDGHTNPSPPLLEAHFIGQRLDKIEPPTVISEEVLFITGIGHGIGIESLSLILNTNIDATVAYSDVHLDLFVRVEPIAVLHCVHDYFADEQLRPVGFISTPVQMLGRKRMRSTDQLIEVRPGASYRNP